MRLLRGRHDARVRFRSRGSRLAGVRGRVTVAVAVLALAAGLTGIGIAGVFGSGAGAQAAGSRASGQAGAGRTASARTAKASRPRPASARRAELTSRRARARARARAGARPRPGALRTSCRSVAHIGDSTSVDLISPLDLPDPAQRLTARYAGVGVRHLDIDASGGRSIVEEMPGQVNGYGVASAWRSEGYHGCWVLALGTNDTANVAVGSSVGLMARVERMMSVAHGEPVMWVNTRTLLSGGPWSEANEQAWDNTLVRALHQYPNMRIFNWAAVAKPGWFLSDGIHYNSVGCAHRARAIADALARAFPRGGHSRSRIVR